MTLPVKGADFYVEYEGLKIMTTVDRMQVRDGQGWMTPDEAEVKPTPKRSISEALRSATSQK